LGERLETKTPAPA